MTKITEIKCNTCGKEFFTEYNNGGSIEHDNYTNNWNMNIVANRFNSGEYSEHDLLLDSITLKGNFCNIRNNSYKYGLEIFECRLLWFKNNGHNKIYNILESQRYNIKSEFNKITEKIIEEKRQEIDKLKNNLL